MTSRMTYEPTTGQWELVLLPPSAWAEESHPVEGVVVYRASDARLAAVVVDEEEMSEDTRALIGALAGLDVVLSETSPRTPSTAEPGGLVPTDEGHAIVMAPGAEGVDLSQRGSWSFDERTLRARIEVPIEDGADPEGLWVSVVDMRSGDVLAAGALSAGDHESATTLTIAVPFAAEDVRIQVDRLPVSRPVEDTPAGMGFWVSIVGLALATLAAVLGGLAVETTSPSTSGLVVYGLEIATMLGLMTVSVMLVERVSRFPLLRPLIGAFVVAGTLAYSNVFYSMLNLVGGWGTWYSRTAEVLQQGSVILLPLVSAWALWSIARKGSGQ